MPAEPLDPDAVACALAQLRAAGDHDAADALLREVRGGDASDGPVPDAPAE